MSMFVFSAGQAHTDFDVVILAVSRLSRRHHFIFFDERALSKSQETRINPSSFSHPNSTIFRISLFFNFFIRLSKAVLYYLLPGS